MKIDEVINNEARQETVTLVEASAPMASKAFVKDQQRLQDQQRRMINSIWNRFDADNSGNSICPI